jgi:hypothetical protein
MKQLVFRISKQIADGERLSYKLLQDDLLNEI